MKDKTVYILGAGASKAANLPVQNELLDYIFSLEPPKNDFDQDLFSSPIDSQKELINNIYEQFDSRRLNIGIFIIDSFANLEDREKFQIELQTIDKLSDPSSIEHTNELESIEELKYKILTKVYRKIIGLKINLEDIFTLFDNIAAGRENFKYYNQEKLNRLHEDLKFCIIYILSYLKNNNCKLDTYKSFAKRLINQKEVNKQKDDVFSIISLNWDNILESEIYKECLNFNINKTNNNQKVLPDYCFYDYPYKQDDNHIPSTNIKAKGFKNIKFLKLHGSINWLECPICGRIFIDNQREIAIESCIEQQCPHCSMNSKQTYDSTLRNIIITPTFMKSLDNLHIKNIWHNAFLELSEATKVVFIGYSFPNADFEMRCLLKKSLSSDTKIEVVLHQSDNPVGIKNMLSSRLSSSECDSILNKIDFPENRYKSFFGDQNINFIYSGFEDFIKTI